ncbi:Dynamin central region-domain-containing protein [Boletus edulis]|uniref:Dynamin central region-domain-containing protein n=1 Tax=Boletus edulis BED1 TaxID=1328754 RepID=A0AAD4C487_BOLED|nr:Dynamin central region-domain-containing protein [Boletus edulis]KAF8448792.1 Dynamin central region-domain-containing protein [Boletus edulis BED1]
MPQLVVVSRLFHTPERLPLTFLQVGSQSAGKSSVLENIVGQDFLPRGQGIVTRRPLVLQLIHTPIPDPSSSPPPYTEWGQFLHIDKRFTDFNEIRREIEQETYRVAGQNKGISRLPISLRIYSPNVLDLTLVDLPGLTKIPVGDQPSDIERQIRNLVTEYISTPNSVILAVSPANVDLANSDSLKLARSVDPQGRRTIGVLTKLDLMDAGTNALDILTGRVYPLKLGFIGVVNRSQQDIISEKSMVDALDSEAEFFKNHAAYRNIAHKNGTKYLARTLNQVLINHIREKLPDMKARLNTLMGQAQQELNSFGDAAIFGDKNQQGALILRLMNQFAHDFIASIEGTKVDMSTKELSGGARIYYIFNDVFGHALATIDSTAGLDNQDIRTAIRNSTGPRPSLFVPEAAFDLLVKPQIKLLEAPSLRCVELVYEELVKLCHNCRSPELERFPHLHAQLIECVSELLRERLGPTSDYSQSLIEIQAAYINTNHPAFISGSAVAAQTATSQASKQSIPPRPVSAEPTNGTQTPENGDESSAEEPIAVNGVPSRDGRSVSSTLHDRARTTGSSSTTGTSTKSSSRTHHGPRHSYVLPPTQSHTFPTGPSSSPHSARETFLNYFFGQNGPGPIGGSSLERSHASLTPTPTGRDVSIVDAPSPTGLMAGKRTLDGNNAAYDMRSLGKHIEAVSVFQVHVMGDQMSFSQVSGSNNASQMTQREEMETSLIRTLIASYFSIVRQSIQDLIPKAIMHFLVNYSTKEVQNRLVATLYKPELFSDLLNEDEALVAERTRVKALLDAYKEAFKTLSDVNLKPL